MIKTMLLFLLFFLLAIFSFGQPKQELSIPEFNDKYCEYIKKLEAGQTDIDYQDFRYSFLESEQFKVANKKSEEMNSLKKEMYEQMNKSKSEKVIKICKQMLSIDYTNMMAHKVLRHTYADMGDTLNAAKYKTIQFGLLNSIVKNGDGKSCASGWPIIQISEAYFILEMLGAKLQKQSTEKSGGQCDKMQVIKKDGTKTTYYFEVSKVFEGYKKLGLK